LYRIKYVKIKFREFLISIEDENRPIFLKNRVFPVFISRQTTFVENLLHKFVKKDLLI